MSRGGFSRALEKGADGRRLTPDEAMALVADIAPDRLHAMGAAALENRRRRFGDRATYVFNLQVNPTNICAMGCSFCNYAASPNADHAYVLDESEIIARIDRLRPTEAHIVGGLNKIWPFRRNLELVREIRRRFPGIHIKAYTAVEIDFFARSEKTSERRILEQLIDAGLDAMPGGGAEIFSDRLWRRHWKNKIGPRSWLRIHRLAHDLGLSSNATMLFGFGDRWSERIDHMLTLRAAQDQSGGYACFIPLPYQPGAGRFLREGPTPIETLFVLAAARLVIDNIDHLKAYWPMAGVDVAAAGLSWGADDMDGTIAEEKIAHLAGAPTPTGLARKRMTETIQTAGFYPVERDGRFRPMPVPAAGDRLPPGHLSKPAGAGATPQRPGYSDA
jgi:aminodeoxyfutalosine synthase